MNITGRRLSDFSMVVFAAILFVLAPNLAEAVPPTVSNVTSPMSNGVYVANQGVIITVTFDQTVNVTGTPTLSLNSSGTASYAFGSGTSTLYFLNVITAGQASADLDYASTSALSAGSGTIQNGGAETAVLTLPAPGAAGSLGANKNIVVDPITQTPVLTLPSTASVIRNISVSYSLPETPSANSVTLVFTDSNAATFVLLLNDSTANQTVSFSYDPTTNPTLLSQARGATFSSLPDGVYTVTLAYSDAVGNPAASVATTGITVDHTAPVITRLGAASIDTPLGSAYSDPGATATDARQGNLTSSIIVTSNVDINVIGSYSVSYDVSDSLGNAATQVSRTVNVVAVTPTPTPTATPTPEATPTPTPSPADGALVGSVSPPVGNLLVYVFAKDPDTQQKGLAQGSSLTKDDGTFTFDVQSPDFYFVEPENDGYSFEPNVELLPSGVSNPAFTATLTLESKAGCTNSDRSKQLQRMNSVLQSLKSQANSLAENLLSRANQVNSESRKTALINRINKALDKSDEKFNLALLATKDLPENIFRCSASAGCSSDNLSARLLAVTRSGRALKKTIDQLAKIAKDIPGAAQISARATDRSETLLSRLVSVIESFPKKNQVC